MNWSIVWTQAETILVKSWQKCFVYLNAWLNKVKKLNNGVMQNLHIYRISIFTNKIHYRLIIPFFKFTWLSLNKYQKDSKVVIYLEQISCPSTRS